VGKTLTAGRPQTLMQAHEVLVRIRPVRDASLPVWLEYYRRSAALYVEIAQVDPGHDGEAMYWAQREARRAEELAARLGLPR
jgi:type II secretory pathway component PulM